MVITSESVRRNAVNAKRAGEALALVSTAVKNRALLAMADGLRSHQNQILRANEKDVCAAKKNRMPISLINRLSLDKTKIQKMAGSVALIAQLPDPVGRLIATTRRPNGLVIKKVGVPIGAILIIYESRPNVTADCMALCLKSGNSVILKGGAEAIFSNQAIFNVLNRAAMDHGIPPGTFQLVASRGRAAVKTLLQMSEWIDLVIPRGGESLIREITKVSKIPVIKHYQGICHVYIDKSADLKKSESIVLNAKVQNPGVCNAMETLLVHRSAAPKVLPLLCESLAKRGVELRGDPETRHLVKGVKKATENDWSTEYLDLILSIRVVKDLKEASAHIQKYGSHHSDAIVTEDRRAADEFARVVDSACVFVNSSTRFNDGGEFGMGAEMGISTDKLHARGPMGLEELTSYKYVVLGNGQTRN